MATLPLTTAPTAGNTTSDGGYWLFGRRQDLGWFVFSLLVPLALYLPAYWIWGKAVIWPLYVVYVVGFATPHTWLTYAVTLPRSGRPNYSRESFLAPVLWTTLIAAMVPLSHYLGGWDLFFTLVTMLGYYHVFKQHLGILRIYDAKYAQTYGDRSIFADFAPFHTFCTLAFALPVLWAWLFPMFEVGVDAQRFTLIHPQLPAWTMVPYLALMAWYLFGTVRMLVRRKQADKPLPGAHLSLATAAGLSYLAAFGLVSPEDFLLSVAIFITYHDLQYAGFVWEFQRQRSRVETAVGTPLDTIHRWALEGRHWRYFAVAIAFSFAVVGTIMSLPTLAGITLVVFHNTLHYLMDGWIWKRHHNARLHEHLGFGPPASARH